MASPLRVSPWTPGWPHRWSCAARHSPCRLPSLAHSCRPRPWPASPVADRLRGWSTMLESLLYELPLVSRSCSSPPPPPPFLPFFHLQHSPELVTFGLAVAVVAAAAAAGCAVLRSSSASARIVSKRDSTPATACCRNEPHRDCFPGAAMVRSRKRKRKRSPRLANESSTQQLITEYAGVPSAPGGRRALKGEKIKEGIVSFFAPQLETESRNGHATTGKARFEYGIRRPDPRTKAKLN